MDYLKMVQILFQIKLLKIKTSQQRNPNIYIEKTVSKLSLRIQNKKGIAICHVRIVFARL